MDQIPFSSINLGRDTSTEGRLVTKWMLNASLSGIGKHHLTGIFPISIFSLKKGTNMNEGDPNYDLKQLALKSLSKRIYPNFVNGDWSQAHEDPNDIDTYMCTMGCRTMIGYDRINNNYKRVGRGNCVPITIILPKLGIKHGICLGGRDEPDLEAFNKEFEETLELVEKALVERFNYIASQPPRAGRFMYYNGTAIDAEKCEDNVFNTMRHFTLAIG